jgi:glutamate racemase
MQTAHFARPDEPPPLRRLRLGVFDSGVGGLSVLRDLQRELPHAALLYLADSGHAPYGERSDGHVTERSHRVAGWLVEQRVDALVIACNTATAVAAASLRAAYPELSIVGVEPGLKPAVALAAQRGRGHGHGHGARIGVMATPATLRSAKFMRLLDAHAGGARVHLQPCPGLAHAIETHDAGSPALLEAIEASCAPLRTAGVDVVVLGCTHYPLVHAQIARALGDGVAIVDTAEAVARQAARRCAQIEVARGAAFVRSPCAEPARLCTTGDAARLRRVAERWLPFGFELAALPL